VTDDPLHVIGEIFKLESMEFIKEGLADWLQVALVSESIKYSFGGQRSCLLSFYNELLLMVEALNSINEHQPDVNETTGKNEQVLLSNDQLANPITVITAFYKKFPVNYIRRELWDWFHAGITFGGTYPENLWPDVVFNLYDYLSCLTEAGYRLSQQRS
jgi:hypothetical protein